MKHYFLSPFCIDGDTVFDNGLFTIQDENIGSKPYPLIVKDPYKGTFFEYEGIQSPEIDEIYSELHKRCVSKRMQLCIAESCTGGLIASHITNYPGSSKYLYGSQVVYSNHAKHMWLGVSPWDIETEGAVSQVVVNEMLKGLLTQNPCTHAIAVSGVAGPDGGSVLKPVGTVWCGVAAKNGTAIVRKMHFLGDRVAVRNQAASCCALMLMELMQLQEIGVDISNKLL